MMVQPGFRAGCLGILLQMAWPGVVYATTQFPGFEGSICARGDCSNGAGTVRTPDGTEYAGVWRSGRAVPGQAYAVSSPRNPSQTTQLYFDANGHPLQGRLFRGEGSGRTAGDYRGGFAQVWNPFLGVFVTTYTRGVFLDTAGRRYEGEFSYVPSKQKVFNEGVYIFQGARIDEDLDEVVRGLFISDRIVEDGPILFRKARVDYLLKLRADYEQASAETARPDTIQPVASNDQVEARNRVVRQAEDLTSGFGTLLSVMGGLANIGGVGGNLSGLQSSALSALTQGVMNRRPPRELLEGVLGQVLKDAANSPQLAKALGGASTAQALSSTLTALARSAQPLSQAQYASQVSQASASGSGSGSGSGTGSDAFVKGIAETVVSYAADTVASTLNGPGTTDDMKILGTVASGLIRQIGQKSVPDTPSSQASPSQRPSNAAGNANPQPAGGMPSTGSLQKASPVASGAPTQPVAPVANLAPDGRRIPKIEGVTVNCTNENGSFQGVEKAPSSANDCRAEVIAHLQIQCRADWMQHPATLAMNACFKQRGVADLAYWPRLN